MNTNQQILELRKTIESRFEVNTSVLSDMLDELNSASYRRYIGEMPLIINSPMEDAIRYRYIMLIEMFKNFSKALMKTYFLFENYKSLDPKEKYRKMNTYIFKDPNVARSIENILNNRNDLAHAWIDEYIDFGDNDFSKKVKECMELFYVLKKYISFVDEQGVLNAKRKWLKDATAKLE